MAYITRELNLTPEEAQKFWPVYNNYVREINQAVKDNPNNEIAFEEKVVGIKKKYQQNFKKILNSDTRVNKFFGAERNFRQRLRNELQNRRFKRFGPQPSQGRRPQQ